MPPRTRVIIDDTNEPECGKWKQIFQTSFLQLKMSVTFPTEPIRVGYEFTVYTTPEGNTTSQGEVRVQLCAVIFQPMSGGAPRDFAISSTTRDGSAGITTPQNEWPTSFLNQDAFLHKYCLTV